MGGYQSRCRAGNRPVWRFAMAGSLWAGRRPRSRRGRGRLVRLSSCDAQSRAMCCLGRTYADCGGRRGAGFHAQGPERSRGDALLVSGTKSVLVVFYPLAFTGTCRGELCSLRDNLNDFVNDAVQTLTISVDSSRVAQSLGRAGGL